MKQPILKKIGLVLVLVAVAWVFKTYTNDHPVGFISKAQAVQVASENYQKLTADISKYNVKAKFLKGEWVVTFRLKGQKGNGGYIYVLDGRNGAIKNVGMTM